METSGKRAMSLLTASALVFGAFVVATVWSAEEADAAGVYLLLGCVNGPPACPCYVGTDDPGNPSGCQTEPPG